MIKSDAITIIIPMNHPGGDIVYGSYVAGSSKERRFKIKLKSITIAIDSSVVNVEGHQECSVKG